MTSLQWKTREYRIFWSDEICPFLMRPDGLPQIRSLWGWASWSHMMHSPSNTSLDNCLYVLIRVVNWCLGEYVFGIFWNYQIDLECWKIVGRQHSTSLAGFHPLIHPRSHTCPISTPTPLHGPLTRYVKLRVAHAPGMPGTISPPPTSKETAGKRPRHASRHVRHERAGMHVGIANPWWREKCYRYSRRMRSVPFYVSGKKPMLTCAHMSTQTHKHPHWQWGTESTVRTLTPPSDCAVKVQSYRTHYLWAFNVPIQYKDTIEQMWGFPSQRSDGRDTGWFLQWDLLYCFMPWIGVYHGEMDVIQWTW